MSQWLCKQCYSALGRDVECFTDSNWLNTLCEQCNQVVGTYHVRDGISMSSAAFFKGQRIDGAHKTKLKAIIKVHEPLSASFAAQIREKWSEFVESDRSVALVIDDGLSITLVDTEMIDDQLVFILPDGTRIPADAPVIELP